jgi:hypothetical protein
VTEEPQATPDDEPPPDDEPVPEEPRRYPSTIGGAFYLAVLAVCLVGIGLVTSGDWRLGVKVMAGALGAAAALRLVLPSRDAGMLAVRHRAIDVLLLAAMGGALWFLAVSIPDQPS